MISPPQVTSGSSELHKNHRTEVDSSLGYGLTGSDTGTNILYVGVFSLV